MRTVLIGAVTSSAVALDSMVAAGHPPALIVTVGPDRATGYSDYVDLRPPAEKAGIPVHRTRNVNDADTISAIRDVEPDILFVIGWSQICREELISLPTIGAIGYHPSPLPKMRGRAVLGWTILLGLEETASTLFWLDEGVDSGPIIGQHSFGLSSNETISTLLEKHEQALAAILENCLDDIMAGKTAGTPQDHSKATYCAKRMAADSEIDWGQSAEQIDALIRASSAPYPGAFTYCGDRKLTIWQARRLQRHDKFIGMLGQIQKVADDGALVMCGDGCCLLLEKVQWEGDEAAADGASLKNHIRFKTAATEYREGACE